MLHESTDPNDSVMVSVADGTQGGAALPISLILPAGQGAERLLGLGDIIVPGINVALFRRIDKTNGLTAATGYFVPCLCGYVLALFCAYGVVGLWCQDQPALLYIVPLSQWTIMAMAWCRGHLGKIWVDGPQAQLSAAPQALAPLEYVPRESTATGA
jgi:hypothetical protein